MGYREECEKLYLENIVLKDAILAAIDDIRTLVDREVIVKDLKEVLGKTYK